MGLWNPKLGDRPKASESKQSPSWSLKTWSFVLESTSQKVLSSTQPLRLAKGRSADALFFLGLLKSSDGQDTVEAEASGSEGSKFTILIPTPQLPFFPANGSLLFCDIKPQLISALSRMHLWLGRNPDYTFNETSCFLNQKQRLHNDNLDYHSNTIGPY